MAVEKSIISTTTSTVYFADKKKQLLFIVKRFIKRMRNEKNCLCTIVNDTLNSE